MRFSAALPVALASGAAAYPGMAAFKEEMLQNIKVQARATAQTTQSGIPGLQGIASDLIGSLGKTLAGLPEAIAENISPDNKRPEPGYTFVAPGPNDSRGPCPGLNLLANHGYLPRDGYVNLGQVNEAAARGFNMAYDLSTVLGVFAILANGNLEDQSWYLGADKNGIGGLNRHSTVEADVSPGREDFYNGCGDNHHLSSRIIKQLISIMDDDPTKTVTEDVMLKHFDKLADFSKKNNPYLYYFPFPLIVSGGAFVFYPHFFSNGTYGAGGVPNWESVASIIGAQYDPATDEIMYVPERFPENWYRRSTPYGAVDTIRDLSALFLSDPILIYGGLANGNLSAELLSCAFQQGLNSITPLGLSGLVEDAEAGAAFALSKLNPLFKDTILGCPSNAISPSPGESWLYPNATQVGGPISSPPAQQQWVKDNVYNKVYFKEAPTTPQCRH